MCPARDKFQELGVSIHKTIFDHALSEEIVIVQNKAQGELIKWKWAIYISHFFMASLIVQ